jgi:hypothetical protein
MVNASTIKPDTIQIAPNSRSPRAILESSAVHDITTASNSTNPAVSARPVYGTGLCSPAPSTLGESEVADEVLVNLSEGGAFDIVGNRPDQANQLGEETVVESDVVAG